MRRATTDRRVEVTRAALHEAFVELFFERGYGEISAADIARRAGVGRSTFYEHYRGKEALLLATIRRAFEPLATIVDGDADLNVLRGALEHFWANRGNSRATRRESSRRAMARVLADVLAQRLQLHEESGPATKRLAALIAELLLGAITGWLAGAVEMSAATLAVALRRCVQALLDARRGDSRRRASATMRAPASPATP